MHLFGTPEGKMAVEQRCPAAAGACWAGRMEPCVPPRRCGPRGARSGHQVAPGTGRGAGRLPACSPIASAGATELLFSMSYPK